MDVFLWLGKGYRGGVGTQGVEEVVGGQTVCPYTNGARPAALHQSLPHPNQALGHVDVTLRGKNTINQ